MYTDDVARSVILLINTIYFNGYWSKPFAENETIVRNFHLNSKTALPVNFMTKTDDFYYSESTELDAKVLRLPYKVNKFNIVYVLFDLGIEFIIVDFVGLQICNVHCFAKQTGWFR